MAKHTPGPWEAEGGSVKTPDPNPGATGTYGVPGPYISRQDREGIYGCELTEADANLIAAAPWMLREMKRILAKCEQYGHTPLLGMEESAAVNRWIAKIALAAIAKAEGRE